MHEPLPTPEQPCLAQYMTPLEMQRWIEVLFARSEAQEERIAKLERGEANFVKHVTDNIAENLRRAGLQIQ